VVSMTLDSTIHYCPGDEGGTLGNPLLSKQLSLV
jgi:hypothetical protein